jgi:hypothetical protein
MRAMVLSAPGVSLQMVERADPMPGDGEIRVKVSACGVCRTDLHVVDAELPGIKYPIIPGHEIVGRVDLVGRNGLLEPTCKANLCVSLYRSLRGGTADFAEEFDISTPQASIDLRNYQDAAPGNIEYNPTRDHELLACDGFTIATLEIPMWTQTACEALRSGHVLQLQYDCACRKSNPNILVVQPAQDRAAKNGPV